MVKSAKDKTDRRLMSTELPFLLNTKMLTVSRAFPAQRTPTREPCFRRRLSQSLPLHLTIDTPLRVQ